MDGEIVIQGLVGVVVFVIGFVIAAKIIPPIPEIYLFKEALCFIIAVSFAAASIVAVNKFLSNF